MLKKYAILTRQFAITLDIATVILSFITAYYIRIGILNIIPFGVETKLKDYSAIFIMLAIVWWGLLNAQGAYKSQRFTSLATEYKSVLKITFYGTLLLIIIAFVLKIHFLPRTLIFIFAATSLFLLMCEKTFVYYMIGKMRKKGYNRKRALIVGTGDLAYEFAEAMKKYPEWGLDVIGFLSQYESQVGNELYNAKILGAFDDFIPILHEQVVEEIIIALPVQDLKIMHNIIDICEQEGVQVRVVSDFYRMKIAKVTADEIHGIPVLTFFTTPTQEWQLFIKRIIDIIISSVALVVLSPILAIIALLIKVTSPGPLFYEWKVIGFNKKPFIGYKFRTMVVNADELREKLLALNEMSGPVFKIKNDPRITPIGWILRKFSLDELPQLWSVLKGDMSLVGPRPAFAHEVAQFENWQRRKFSVKPGLTCLWQVSGRSQIKNFDEWARLDLKYIDNWSLWLDFKILLKTIPVVLLGKGY